jgi:hypothetical protein
VLYNEVFANSWIGLARRHRHQRHQQRVRNLTRDNVDFPWCRSAAPATASSSARRRPHRRQHDENNTTRGNVSAGIMQRAGSSAPTPQHRHRQRRRHLRRRRGQFPHSVITENSVFQRRPRHDLHGVASLLAAMA